MPDELKYRLSFEEIIFLGSMVSTATEIYGIQSPIKRENDAKTNWETVKQNLIQKRVAYLNNEQLILNNGLASAIQTICEPKYLVILRSKDNNAYRTNGYYIRNGLAITLENEKNVENGYLIQLFQSPYGILQRFQDAITFDKSGYANTKENAELTGDIFQKYMTYVKDSDFDSQFNILSSVGFSKDSIEDMEFALKNKKHILTMFSISFREDIQNKKNLIDETLVYSGKKSLWQFTIKRGTTQIMNFDEEFFNKKSAVFTELLSIL